MGIDALCALPVEPLAAKDCLMLLWAIPYAAGSPAADQAWGFTFKTVAFVWLKRNKKSPTWFYGLGPGQGQMRKSACLPSGGHPKRYSRSVHQFIISPLRNTARNPTSPARKSSSLRVTCPCAELFARQKTPGWDVWGNEVDKRFFPVRTRNEVILFGLCHCPQRIFTKVKSKVVFGLTKRQLICFGGALLVGVPLFLLIRGRIPTSAAALLMVFAMLRAFCWRCMRRHGQPLKWWYTKS